MQSLFSSDRCYLAMKDLPLQSTYELELLALYDETNVELLGLLAKTVSPHARRIAKAFYTVMLQDKNAVTFLTNDMVENRLTSSMTAWIEDLFDQQNELTDIETLIKYQVDIGHVHARIDLPMSLVNFGMRTLKATISEVITHSTLTHEQKINGLILSNALLDTVISLINDSYLSDIVISEKNAQAFRMHVSSQNLAFDCERLRTSLLDWMRKILTKLHETHIDLATLPTIRHSDFGLWLTHKGALILAGRTELSLLMQFVSDANAIVDEILTLDHRNSDNMQFNRLIDNLNQHVTKVLWVLGNTAQEMLDIDSGRDALTHLFNRRYLATVLLHETECSTKTGLRYGILYLDIDLFKVFNDTYGHENGDVILQQFAGCLLQSVRTGDFVFRYGGEEFLIVLADIQEETLPIIAEKVRKLIAETKFKLLDETTVPVTVSIGAAMHDGHPDYQRTIRNADASLYKAKENGRNCVQLYKAT